MENNFDVFDAQKIAEEKVLETYKNTCLATGVFYVAVSKKKNQALICPNERVALDINLAYSFKVKYHYGDCSAELIG